MSQVFTRKLQKTGNSITASIPKNWLTMNGLAEGDSVEFILNEDGSLNIKSIDKQTRKNKLFKELVNQDHDLMERLKNV
ncbi:AbrB/MazE/SpoVT family DNA-binding domain-containing protein [Latilactobacillus sakei]|uniref:AbrB/MazE/SpoVT family DNA-binding domain-containing protein n=1 Tax=Latilactobacillus sakei TaxID=1599 RepID=A0AAF0K400_LATSK|nr:AbrB/MazE/SpoVT family DNA-binding domain-containing protein [Latilactobacillus sakei]MDN4009745.1 AbrB/MazE/SpoVT family DNA-binding domain-containing protein [Latilactobacillus sakei]WGI19036.1 AbrB/MazE/SpoVT family DNA-binding domain-containing protein [Latilactobacillus sakei]